MKKKTTKTQEAKKILKKKFKVNTKIVFTEDGEVRSIQNNCILVGTEFIVSRKTKILTVYICIKRRFSEVCGFRNWFKFCKTIQLPFRIQFHCEKEECWAPTSFHLCMYKILVWELLVDVHNRTSFLPIIFNFRWNKEPIFSLQKCKMIFL